MLPGYNVFHPLHHYSFAKIRITDEKNSNNNNNSEKI